MAVGVNQSQPQVQNYLKNLKTGVSYPRRPASTEECTILKYLTLVSADCHLAITITPTPNYRYTEIVISDIDSEVHSLAVRKAINNEYLRLRWTPNNREVSCQQTCWIPIPIDLPVRDKENLSILLQVVLHLYLTSPYTLAIHVFSLWRNCSYDLFM